MKGWVKNYKKLRAIYLSLYGKFKSVQFCIIFYSLLPNHGAKKVKGLEENLGFLTIFTSKLPKIAQKMASLLNRAILRYSHLLKNVDSPLFIFKFA